MAISFSGMSSGIDTTSIVTALVNAEGSQQTLLKNRQATASNTATVYASLVDKLKALSTAAATVGDTKSWVGTTATSSSTSVTAKATSTASSSLTFDVTAVAAAHTLISAEAKGSLSDVVASTGSIDVTGSDGTVTSLAVGTGSLGEVVSAVNASSTGLVASAVQVSAGSYRLQLASKSTGAASAFTVSGLDGFTGMNVLSAGADATVHVGDLTNGYDATSSSNTFDKLVNGLSFTVSKKETGVTVGAALDGSAIADNVSAMVDAANSMLVYIDAQSTYDPASKQAGPLNGESSVRQLEQNVLSLVGGAGAAGMNLSSTGRLKFDKAAFVTAFKADPAKVATQYGGSTTFANASGAPTTSVLLSSATSAVKPGTYPVLVTQAPAREQWQLTPPGGSAAGATIAVTRGTSTISYTGAVGETLAQSAAALNTLLAGSSLGISASVNGSALQLTAGDAGSGGAFTTTLDGAAGTRLTAGADVAGAIDNNLATGSGNRLSIPTGTGGAVGLSLTVNTTAAEVAATGGAVGSVTYREGLAQSLVRLAADATATGTGSVSSAQNSVNTQVKTLQTQIDDWDRRLTSYRAMLVNQFTVMETTLNTLKSSLSALGSLTSSLSTTTSSSSSSTGTVSTG